jgi:hypothetical protein
MIVAALLLLAGQKIELPAEVRGEPGAFIAITPKTDGKRVRYYSLDAGLNSFPAELLSNPTATVVTAPAPGRYRLLAYTAIGDMPSDPVIITVVVGEAAPKPKEPSAYERSLLAIWGAIQEADRDASRVAVAQMYRACSVEARKEHGTAGALYEALLKISSTVPRGKLATLRERVGAEIATVVPDDPGATINAAQRQQVSDIYAITAALLESVK